MRFLHLADTHLGMALPLQQRKPGWRRGHDIIAAYYRALAPALRGDVDVVIHSGDLFDRSQPPGQVIDIAVKPLRQIADAGVPVVIVPGNHERSNFPGGLLFQHPLIHLLNIPRTAAVEVDGVRAAFSGFGFLREEAAARFPQMIDATGWRSVAAHVRVLVSHQLFAGARVGNHVFRSGADVVDLAGIPTEFDYVAAGHVHPHQVLSHPSKPGLRIAYAGSPERMSYNEAEETKGVICGHFTQQGATFRFCPLAVRPLARLRVIIAGPGDAIAAAERISDFLAAQPDGAMVNVRVIDPERLCAPLPSWDEHRQRFAELIVQIKAPQCCHNE